MSGLDKIQIVWIQTGQNLFLFFRNVQIVFRIVSGPEKRKIFAYETADQIIWL